MSEDGTPAEREVRRLHQMYDEVVDCYIEIKEKCDKYKKIIEVLLIEGTMSASLREVINDALVKLDREGT
jgi:hypothetical protein